MLLLHDVGDIFLYAAKSATYKGISSSFLFGTFAVVFFVSRIILFPIFCIAPAVSGGVLFIWGSLKAHPSNSVALILPIMLIGLYVLHLIWWKMIWGMILKAVKDKKVDKDVRSDSD